MGKIRVIELFAGIGACSKALKNIGIEEEIVEAVEIDKYAIGSFNAIHGTKFKEQDIKEWEKYYEEIDIIMHGSPCQDFSLAGKQAGGDIGSGTRSSLMYETIRIVGKIRPRYVIWENVKNVLSKKHKHNFENYIRTLNMLGYNSYYKVLNAKDYGIPQNRERVYTISIRKEIDKGEFKFPEKEELLVRLKDILEKEVEEKYYLSEKQMENLRKNRNGNCNPSGKGMNGKIYTGDIAPTITTNKGEGAKIQIEDEEYKLKGAYGRKFGNKGKIQDIDGICSTLQAAMGNGGGNVPIIKNKTFGAAMRGRYNEKGEVEQQIEISGREIANAITTVQKDSLISKELRIRKLTPKECWRLMGFEDEDFEKAKEIGTSNTQLYKQAGNSICVPVLEKIFKELLKEGGKENE